MQRAALLAFALCVTAPAAWAQQDSDLDRIPSAVGNADTVAVGDNNKKSSGKYYLEDDFALSGLRGALVVPVPGRPSSRWANSTFLDGVDQWTLAKDLTFDLSDRLGVTEADGVGFPTKAVRNDVREAYVSWEPAERFYLEAGRINLRNGIALGFNPTDFFKPRTTVSQVSLDPSAQRENRLGVVMLRGQRIWDGGSLTIAYAPKLYDPSPLANSSGFGLNLDRTNTADRVEVALNIDVEQLSPQFLVYHDSGRTHFGFNVSRPIGQSIVAYAEWAGAVEPNDISDAIVFGKKTGTLPSFAPVLPPTSSARTFRNDLAAGASWTSKSEITINLEYHYHQAGFTTQDWRNWFSIGSLGGTQAQELWYVRGVVSDRQQPITQQQIFVRADASDAFVEHLELGVFSLIDAYDGSALAQAYASYNISDNWTAGAYLSGDLGGRRSEWGSYSRETSAIFQVVRYF